MTKILIIGINFTPELIGVGKYTGELAEYLRSQGDEVRVITAPPHYPNWVVPAPYRAWRYVHEKTGSLAITRCPMWARNQGRGIWRILAPLSFALSSFFPALKEMILRRPDVLLCIEPTFFSSIAPVMLARLLRIRSVIHVQDLEVDAAFAVGYVSNNYAKAFAFSVERFVLRRFDRIITISEKMREKLIDKKLDKNKIAIVRNWIAPDLLASANGHKSRQIFNIPDTTFIALYSGHIGKKQDLATVLSAAEILSHRHDIQFVVAGDGPEKHNLQIRFGHLKNIIWLPLQPTTDFLDLLRAANCHLMPQHESAADLVLPSKLGAILATGAPLVVTAEAETELALFLNDTAYIVKPGMPEKLANTILETLNDDPDHISARLKKASELSAAHLLPKFRHDLLIDE